MTWMHWIVLLVLAALALGMAAASNNKANARMFFFSLFAGMILLLVLGQPK